MTGDLDGFFARCDDVLTDWDGSPDAMYGKVPASSDVEALPGDSYYEQWVPGDIGRAEPTPLLLTPAQTREIIAAANEFAVAFTRTMQDMARVLNTVGPRFVALAAALREAEDDEPTDTRERALTLRRQRNTGPADRYRLDGTRR